jgi:hypothetical protein
MIPRYQCTYTSDIRKKKKSWKDGILKLNDLKVTIHEVDDPKRSVTSSFIKPAVRNALVDGDEVEIGRFLVALGDPIFDDIETKDATPTQHTSANATVLNSGSIAVTGKGFAPYKRPGLANATSNTTSTSVLSSGTNTVMSAGKGFVPYKRPRLANATSNTTSNTTSTSVLSSGMNKATSANHLSHRFDDASFTEAVKIDPRRFTNIRDLHKSLDEYSSQYSRAVSGEINCIMTSALKAIENTVCKALKSNGNNATSSSAFSHKSVNQMKDVHSLIRKSGVPYVMNVKLKVNPPYEDSDKENNDKEKDEKCDKSAINKGNAVPLGSKDGTKLYMLFNEADRYCPNKAIPFSKDDIWMLWGANASKNYGTSNQELYPLPFRSGIQCGEVFLVRSMWHGISSSSMLQVQFMDATTTIPASMGGLERVLSDNGSSNSKYSKKSKYGDNTFGNSYNLSKGRGVLQMRFHAVRLCNVRTDLIACDMLNQIPEALKILNNKLNVELEQSDPRKPSLDLISKANLFRSTLSTKSKASESLLADVALDQVVSHLKDIQLSFYLNKDQSEILLRVGRWFNADVVRTILFEDEDGYESKVVENEDVLLVTGVFGSGKSHLLAALCTFISRMKSISHQSSSLAKKSFNYSDSRSMSSTSKDKLNELRVLISASTNIAVDRVLCELVSNEHSVKSNVSVARVGMLTKIDKDLRPSVVHSHENPEYIRKDIAELLKQYTGSSGSQEAVILTKMSELTKKKEFAELQRCKLDEADVVGVTCASALSAHLALMGFDVLFLDESSQMTEPTSLLALSAARPKKLILVGDPKQLPPAVQSTVSTDTSGGSLSIRSTLYDRLISLGFTEILLATQYRCHPNISRICSNLFYSSKLKDGITGFQRRTLVRGMPSVLAIGPDDGQALGNEERNGESIVNVAEAMMVVEFLKFFRKAINMTEHTDKGGVKEASGSGDDVESMPTIGCICLYRAQSFLVKKKVGEILGSDFPIKISTVDAFQGNECDLILLCTTRNSGSTAFLSDACRVNVAISRAKHHLIIIGNQCFLRSNELWKRVISACLLNVPDVKALQRFLGPVPVPPGTIFDTNVHQTDALKTSAELDVEIDEDMW